MRSFLDRFIITPYRRVSAEFPWFGPVFAALFVAMLVNLLTDSMVETIGTLGSWIVMLALFVLVMIFILLHEANIVRRYQSLGPIQDVKAPNKFKGLIFIFSNKETFREAIHHHQPMLQSCWLLVTTQMQHDADEAKREYPEIVFSDVIIPGLYDAQACYLAVRNIYRNESVRLKIEPSEIISDITGGTKPMTVGMVAACIEDGYAIEHVPTHFDPVTRAAIRPLPPIEIRMRAR